MDCSEGLQRSIWSFDVTAINISSEQTADRANVLYKIYILLSVIIFFSVLNYSIPQRDFSDTDTYLYYIDYIYFFRGADWWHFEGLSKITMIALRFLTQDTLDAVSILRYVLILVFSLSMYYMYRSISWQGLAIAVALYAPLLGLVTIRATPPISWQRFQRSRRWMANGDQYPCCYLASCSMSPRHWRFLPSS